MMKNTALALLLLAPLTAVSANQLVLVNEMDALGQQGLKATVTSNPEQKKPTLEQVKITVNGNQTEDLLSAYPNQSVDTSAVTLNEGDQYQITAQGNDGQWYHTNDITYQQGENPNNDAIISISGKGLPNAIKQDGKTVSAFYNANGFKSFATNCFGYSATAVGGIMCNIGPYVMEGPMPGVDVGEFGGTTFVDNQYVDNHPDAHYNGSIAAVLFYEHLNMDDPQGHVRLYGNFGGLGVGGGAISNVTIKKK